jgi:hypothetical protein
VARAAHAVAALALAACAPSSDPAAGGFANAVAGLAGGGYEARVAERQAGVDAAEARGEALSAELARLEAEHRQIVAELARRRASLAAAGTRLDPETAVRVDAALAGPPPAADPQARAAALQRAIADARLLSEQLATLSADPAATL